MNSLFDAARRCLDAAGIEDAIRVARDYGGEMLMESMVVGDELTVGILGEVALPSIRIVPRGEWYDYNAKYIADDTQYLCPGLEGEQEGSEQDDDGAAGPYDLPPRPLPA